MRRPRRAQLPPQGHGHARRRSGEDGRNLRHRMLLASALLHEHLRLPHHSRPRSRRGHGLQGGQPRHHRMADFGRRRRPRNRRQPLHPRRAPQHRYQHAPAQQQDLRPHQRAVLPHLAARFRLEIIALRHHRRPLHPRRARVRRPRQLLRPLDRRGTADHPGGPRGSCPP